MGTGWLQPVVASANTGCVVDLQEVNGRGWDGKRRINKLTLNIMNVECLLTVSSNLLKSLCNFAVCKTYLKE